MKKSIFTLALAFIALFGFNTAQAQNAHVVTDAPLFIDGNGCVTATIAGLGAQKKGNVTIELYLEYTYSFDCWNTEKKVPSIVGNTRTKTFKSGAVEVPIDRNGKIVLNGFCVTGGSTSIGDDLCNGDGLISINETLLGSSAFFMINGNKVTIPAQAPEIVE